MEHYVCMKCQMGVCQTDETCHYELVLMSAGAESHVAAVQGLLRVLHCL